MNKNFQLVQTSDISESYKYFIVFRLNEKRYALSIKNVIEIISIPQLETTGIMPKNVIGIFNYNGMMINVVDLCGFLNEERKNITINNKLMIVAVEGNCFALHVNQVENVTKFDTANIQDVPFNMANSILKEIYKTEDDVIGIFAVSNLVTFST